MKVKHVVSYSIMEICTHIIHPGKQKKRGLKEVQFRKKMRKLKKT